MKAYISVIGSGDASKEITELAHQVGRLLAERGAILVCGGLGGVMNAAAKGAKEAGGLAVGILPGSSRKGASSFLDVALPTGIGQARNALVVQAGDAVIAIGGEFGTLSETGFALKLGKPVVGLKTWELYREGKEEPHIIKATNAEDAVEIAMELAEKGL